MRRAFSAAAPIVVSVLLPGCLGACNAGSTASPPNSATAAAPAGTPSVASGELLPAERRTTWNPGIPGGIPVRTTLCASLDANAFGNGARDASGEIQAALEACPVGQVVRLSAGVFRVDRTIFIRKGVVLRGAGPTATQLRMTSGYTGGPIVLIGVQYPGIASSTNLTSNAVKGARSVTVASTAGLAVGDIVVVDELTDTSYVQWNAKGSPPGSESRGWFTRFDRPVAQAMEIESISGQTVGFTTPFHIGFDTAHTAQLARFNEPAVKHAGLEDLRVYGGGASNITLSLAAYSWIKNVESEHSLGSSVGLSVAFRCVVRDSYFHHSPNLYPGGGAYGLSVSSGSADNLVENNIFWHFNKVMVMQASGGGNVIGYNYFEDGFIGSTPRDYTDWMETGMNAAHMTCPHFELFEGNQAFNIDADADWGNSVYITYFRNHATAKRRSFADVDNRRAIGLEKGAWWYTFIGNVLSTPDASPAPLSGFTYENNERPWRGDPAPMWRLGYDTTNWDAPADAKVLSTVIRDGNFDFVTNEVRWDRNPQPLPDSLYLTAKPAFFGESRWPWVDATGAVKLHTLPARARFDAMVR
jgi:Pectate lyase superfamily protein